MTGLLTLAWRSLMNRKGSALLTLLAIALSTALFLGVEKAREGARDGFGSTLSGTDLIVGAPTGEINLLLSTVFRMGAPSAEIDWDTYQALDGRDDVAWTVPISLGDSHRGYRVMGTTQAYFEHYKYGDRQSLRLSEGVIFDDIFDVVIGAEIARTLNYPIGQDLIMTHGLGEASLDGSQHKNRPYRVVGIIAPTGTPVDQTLHVSLEGMTAMHVGWESGAKNPLADRITADTIRGFDNLTPKTVTAVFLGLENRATILRTRREINTAMDAPLMAIIPGAALADLWNVTALAERALIAVSVFVIIVGLMSILISILTSLNERRREMSILRAIGARPGHVFGLMVLEAALIGFLGALLGIALVHLLLALTGPMVNARYGIALSGTGPGLIDLYTLLAVTFAATLIGMVPAILAMRRALSDGLTLKV